MLHLWISSSTRKRKEFFSLTLTGQHADRRTCWRGEMIRPVQSSHYTRSSRAMDPSRISPTGNERWTGSRILPSGPVSQLDSDVSTFCNFLNDWVAKLKSSDDMQRYLNARNRLTWPDLQTPLDYSVPYELGTTMNGETSWETGSQSRHTAIEKGQHVFYWERPLQSRLKKMSKYE